MLVTHAAKQLYRQKSSPAMPQGGLKLAFSSYSVKALLGLAILSTEVSVTLRMCSGTTARQQTLLWAGQWRLKYRWQTVSM